MATFYGQVEGFSRTTAGRRGSDFIKSSVQSWNGSVITRLWYNDKGVLNVSIALNKNSGFSGDELPYFTGSFEELIRCFEEWKEQEVIECQI